MVRGDKCIDSCPASPRGDTQTIRGWRSGFPGFFRDNSGAAAPDLHRLAFRLSPRSRSGTPWLSYHYYQVYLIKNKYTIVLGQYASTGWKETRVLFSPGIGYQFRVEDVLAGCIRSFDLV